MSASWFPLTESTITDAAFRALTHTERLYFFTVLADFSRPRTDKRPYFKADFDFAFLLGVSVDKIRKARRKLQDLGFLTCKSGFKSRGKGVATTYTEVRGATLGEGDFFAQVPRFQFERLLEYMRVKTFTIKDVLTWVALAYCRHRFRGKREDDREAGRFFVTKRDLTDLAGVPDPAVCVQRLHDLWTFKGGDHLFEYRGEYHKFTFLKWDIAADQNDHEREQRERLAAALSQARVKAGLRPPPPPTLEDVRAFWNQHTSPAHAYPDADLKHVMDTCGAGRVLKEMKAYFARPGYNRRKFTPFNFNWWFEQRTPK